MTTRTTMGIDLDLLAQGLAALAAWESNWPAVEQDPALNVDPERQRAILAELANRLAENYPFFHPLYAGQMLKPAHPLASIAYFLAQQINPNNHALDGGPATAKLEREAIAQLAAMVGYDPAATLGHLTSSGTIANLEALWISRQLHPDRAIAYSAEAHYTHSRMCELLGVRGVKIAVDAHGRMDLDDLRSKIATEQIGTIVATAGTTALGAVDPIHELLPIARAHGLRIHVDSAYGGFYSLLAQLPVEAAGSLPESAAHAYRAISECDSVVIDPHKHGLQPYGCGSVLFRDAGVGHFYKHDSPYTYFTSADLHLGEISLECSRAGAAAAALWATLQAFPLKADNGLGPVLRKCRQAAALWADLITESSELDLLLPPELDIVVFFPKSAADRRVSAISALTNEVFERGMHAGPDAYFLAKVTLTPDRLTGHPDLIWDQPSLTGLRSVLMKPEHLAVVPTLQDRIVGAVRELS